MPVEPSKKIAETPIIRREEDAGFQQRRKPRPRKDEPKKDPEKPGKIDIKI